jgi:hypothetical protein
MTEAIPTEDPVDLESTVETGDKAEKEDKAEIAHGAKKEGKAEAADKAKKEHKTAGTADKAETRDEAKNEDKAQTENEAEAFEGTPGLQVAIHDLSKACGDEKDLQYQMKKQNDEEECGKEDPGSNISGMAVDENKPIVSKFFVHSQWLAVQSPFFKALFYSGMKETHSKEVVIKIYEHELEAHETLIEAMYQLGILSDKDCRLVLQVLVLAQKYDVLHVIKKCKYVLLTTTLSLEMCECILKEIERLPDTGDIHAMVEKFLVKEFSPMDELETLDKFLHLSEVALRVLLRSDNLASMSENIIFTALMKWIEFNIPCAARDKYDLLDLLRFEFMSADFLYDVVQNHIVASKMPGFNKYLVKGLAYNAFSEARREELKPKPKKRPEEIEDPTYSWMIDKRQREKLTRSPGTFVFSNRFLYQKYSMQLKLCFANDSNKCNFYLMVCDLEERACVQIVSYKAKSDLFAKRKVKIKKPFTCTRQASSRGCCLERNKALTEQSFKIDVWVDVA